MKIKRVFTKKSSDPYGSIRWVARTSEIRNPDGSLIFRMENVIVPDFWSQIATDILAQKYFRKAGVPMEDGSSGGETDARQVFHRLASTWRLWGERAGYFDSDEDAETFYDETVFMLANQMSAPNSPQWFNTGLHAAYGISGPPQGHFFVNPETNEVEKSTSAYERPQPHACFILSVADDLVNEGGIIDLVAREARLFKYGSGTGSNFSKIRGLNEPLSGGGRSSGLLSFLKIADRSAAGIKSGGTTRRAAKMVTLDVDHPDIEKYVSWKVDEEYKVASMAVGSKVLDRYTRGIIAAIESFAGPEVDRYQPDTNPELKKALVAAIKADVPTPALYQLLHLARQGEAPLSRAIFNTEWDDEAYNTVSGQSSNNSVRLSNEFIQAVLDDDDWTLRTRIDGAEWKKVKARSLWDLVARSAWSCADPGVQYHTTINEWHTCSADGEIRASNPCSEYMFLDDTACNLASLNLMRFYDVEGHRFKIDEYVHAVRIWTLILEISVVMAQFPSPAVARKSYDFRTLGLGYANLGTLLMVMGIPYDSDEGRAIAAALTAILTGESYAESARLARQAGPFPRYETNKTDMLRVIRNHRRAAYSVPAEEYEGLTVVPQAIDESFCPEYMAKAARVAWDAALELGEKHGYRNAQVSCIAPTGTIGLVMDCDTTGIEPDFSLVKFKKLAGGGYFKIINQSIPPALKKLGYTKKHGDEIIAYCLGYATLDGAPGVSSDALRAKGLGETEIAAVNAAVKNAFSLAGAVGPWVFDPKFLEEKLSLPESTWALPGFNLLKHLGFTDEQIAAAELYACGTMTLEGAPGLKIEHYPVFDTANPSGRTGTRSIRWQAHVGMMAAAQPFVSGAISKTINMPSTATVEDVKGAYHEAWQLMLKAIALYRDGSKLSQPLSSLNAGSDPLIASLVALESLIASGQAADDAAIDVRPIVASPPATAQVKKRNSLPNRRVGYTQKAKIGNHSLFLRTGEYEDGRLGEIFLDMHKEGAAFRSLLNSFAITVSLGLQYGVPLEEYVDAFTFSRFEPNGVVRGHDNIKMSTSVLDFIFRDLALTYLDRKDLVQVSPDDLVTTGTGSHESEATEIDSESEGDADGQPPPVRGNANGRNGHSGSENGALAAKRRTHGSTIATAVDDAVRSARLQGYEGDPCPTCGHFTLVRNGTCLKCVTCGSTTGCS